MDSNGVVCSILYSISFLTISKIIDRKNKPKNYIKTKQTMTSSSFSFYFYIGWYFLLLVVLQNCLVLFTVFLILHYAFVFIKRFIS